MAIQSLEHFICDNSEIPCGFRVRIYTEFIFNAQIVIQRSIYRKRFKQPKWTARSRWSIRPISAWGSIETTTIGKMHPRLFYGAYSILYIGGVEVGALFSLGKNRRNLILAPDISKNKAPVSVNKIVSVCLNLSQLHFPVCAGE